MSTRHQVDNCVTRSDRDRAETPTFTTPQRSLLGKWLALSWTDKRALAQSWIMLPMVWIGLRVVSLPRMHGWLLDGVVKSKIATTRSLTFADAQRLAAIVAIAAKHGPSPTTCLTRSMTLMWLLHKRYIHSTLRLGSRLDSGQLDAHAWVEYEGKPVNDRPEVVAQFTSFGDLTARSKFQRF